MKKVEEGQKKAITRGKGDSGIGALIKSSMSHYSLARLNVVHNFIGLE